MKLRTLFFCGDRSPYGLCHLLPILDAFTVEAIVVATDERWNLFRDALSGKRFPEKGSGTKLGRASRFLLSGILPGKLRRRSDKYSRGQVIADLLKGRKIPIWQVFDVNGLDFLGKVRHIKPELILSAAYPQILSNDLIAVPSRGSINFHPSLLPKYRGAHPHFWAIVLGEKESGLTAHFMTEEIDAGDILAQISYPIDQYDYRQLYEKMIQETPGFVKLVARKLQEGRPAVKQDPTKATTFRNDRDIHRRIFWNIHTAAEINNLSRTLSAFCFFRGRKVTLQGTFVTNSNRNLTNDVRVEPGTIVDVNEDFLAVKTTDACINIRKLGEGNKMESFEQWVIKHGIKIGEKFE